MDPWMKGARCAVRLASVGVLLWGTAPANGADLDYQVSAGAGRSDNVRRTPSNEIDENILSAGLRFAFDENSKRVRADVFGDFHYYDYLDNTYDPELLGKLYADTAFALVPDRVSWSLSDQFGQVLTDPFLPATPENRENINYLSTGPDFVTGLGGQMRLRLSARYGLVNYETSPLDSSSTNAELALIREVSDRRSISLNASVQQVTYDEAALASDFDVAKTFLRYEAAGVRTNLGIDAGFTRLERDSTNESESGALLRIDASRRLSGSSTLALVGGRSFSTSAGAFANDQGISSAGSGTAPGRQTSDPFTLDQLALTWRFDRNRTGFELGTSWSQHSFEDDPSQDQTLTAFSTRYRRDLSAATNLLVNASFSRVASEPPRGDYRELLASVTLEWRLSRNLSFDVKYDFNKRDSDGPDEYTENRLWLTIAFGRGEPRTSPMAPVFGVDARAPARTPAGH